jgi:phosphotransferase system HPr (HPr) family protein
MLLKEIVIRNKMGLHARSAALFVKIANKFNSQITVICDEKQADGKSILGILMLGAKQGTNIILKAEGENAQFAINELEKVLSEG